MQINPVAAALIPKHGMWLCDLKGQWWAVGGVGHSLRHQLVQSPTSPTIQPRSVISRRTTGTLYVLDPRSLVLFYSSIPRLCTRLFPALVATASNPVTTAHLKLATTTQPSCLPR